MPIVAGKAPGPHCVTCTRLICPEATEQHNAAAETAKIALRTTRILPFDLAEPSARRPPLQPMMRWPLARERWLSVEVGFNLFTGFDPKITVFVAYGNVVFR